MLIFINLIYYHLSSDECYLKGPNAVFDLGEKKRKERGGRKDGNLCLFGNDMFTTGSELRIEVFGIQE